jgi:hypothetical protein
MTPKGVVDVVDKLRTRDYVLCDSAVHCHENISVPLADLLQAVYLWKPMQLGGKRGGGRQMEQAERDVVAALNRFVEAFYRD